MDIKNEGIQYKVIDSRHMSGLFSVMTVLLENIMLAEANEHFVVNLGAEYLYYDKRWGSNVWEYYFSQPKSSDSITEILSGKYPFESGFIFKRKGLLDITNRTASYEKAIFEASKLFGSEVTFTDEMTEHLRVQALSVLPEGNFITVHRRETDFGKHGKVPKISRLLDACDSFVDQGSEIFLATDSAYAIYHFKKRYGRRVLHYINTTRSYSGRPLHSRKHIFGSPAKAGRDACVDAYLLSKGQTLIRTRSNVSTFARILNPNMKWIEVDEDIQYS